MARVLVVINSLAGGGAERVVTRLLASLAGRGAPGDYQVALLEPALAYGVPGGVPVHLLGRDRGRGLGRLAAHVGALARLVRLVRRERPQAVVAFMHRASALALVASRVVPDWPRTVVSERTAPSGIARGWRGLVLRGLLRGLYPAADRVIAVSAGVAEELVAFGVPRTRVEVVPNPVSAAELEAQAAAGAPHPFVAGGEPLLVAVGRLIPDKGYPVLLEALAYLAGSRPARLVVYGEGPEGERLRALSRSLGVADLVAWAGFDPNPFPTVARADVFVLASRREGFPNALLEAMALGRAVVATDCRYGPRELLAGGACGRLVPTDDSRALAAAIEGLLADDAERRALGDRARRRAADFALPAVVARYRALLEDRA